MTIDKVVGIAKKVHDAEGYNLGSSSTREYRNAFWARAIGCVYHGHPVYNPTPDPQWHIKDAGGGRPQSDDVTVTMPSRVGYDCIPGAGADGYSFNFNPHGEVLGPEQHVYAPPKPAGSSGGTTPTPLPPPCPDPAAHQPKPVPPYAGDPVFDQIFTTLEADMKQANAGGLNGQSGRWAGRICYDHYIGGLTLEASTAKHRAEWRQILGLPPL